GLVFILEIAPLFLGFESGDKDDSLYLPKMPSITINSIFAYEKLKSLTNQSLNCVLNAFDFPLIRAAFSLQDKDARRVIGVIRLTRFQTLLSQLEIHVASVSHEDANQKFLSTNDVSTSYSVSSPSVLKSHKEGSSSYTDEVIHSFFVNQSSSPQLDYDDLEQINDDDIKEMDLKWQVAMISKIKKFHKRTGRKLAKRNQDSRKRDVGYNGNKARYNGKRPTYQDDSKALVTIDGEDIDWSGHVEEDT
nr:ribonuclease H-like domain-containing protein [Tanacetum cinerariifolium]